MKLNLSVRKTPLVLTAVLTLVLACLTSVYALDDDGGLTVAALKGPTAMGLIELIDEAERGEENYTFELLGAPDEVVAGLAGGTYDAAAIPCNLASVLYNRTEGKIRLAAINTLGVLYIVETGDTVKSIADLKGKTVYATGKGATPEVALRYVLKQNGIDPDNDLTIEFKSEATEVAAIMKDAPDAAIAMLPQPFVTVASMQNDKIRVALDMTQEWNAVSGGNDLLTGCVAVRSAIIDENPEAVGEFLSDYEDSVEFVREKPAEAAALIEKFAIVPKAAIAEKALPGCNIVFIEGQPMKTAAEAYLNVLFEADPKTVGGELPAEDFYYFRAED